MNVRSQTRIFINFDLIKSYIAPSRLLYTLLVG